MSHALSAASLSKEVVETVFTGQNFPSKTLLERHCNRHRQTITGSGDNVYRVYWKMTPVTPIRLKALLVVFLKKYY